MTYYLLYKTLLRQLILLFLHIFCLVPINNNAVRNHLIIFQKYSLYFTGIVPGVAQSKSATQELIGLLKFVEALENNFEFVAIWAWISRPIDRRLPFSPIKKHFSTFIFKRFNEVFRYTYRSVDVNLKWHFVYALLRRFLKKAWDFLCSNIF